MRILIVADGRSPITHRFLGGLVTLGHTISLVSTFPCDPIPVLADLQIIPVAFGHLAGSSKPVLASSASVPNLPTVGIRRVVSHFRPLFMTGRYYLGPLSLFLSRDTARFQQVVFGGNLRK